MALVTGVRPDVHPTAWGRITAVMLRQMYLYKRTLHRWLEAVYWPVLDITLWGLLSRYITKTDPTSRIGFGLLGALISWDILFRAQQSVSVGFLEDMWSRNVLNVWSTPIRAWEYVGGTVLHMSSRNPTETDCCARNKMSHEINAPSRPNPIRLEGSVSAMYLDNSPHSVMSRTGQ